TGISKARHQNNWLGLAPKKGNEVTGRSQPGFGNFPPSISCKPSEWTRQRDRSHQPQPALKWTVGHSKVSLIFISSSTLGVGSRVALRKPSRHSSEPSSLP